VGTVVDTTVFIVLERAVRGLPFSDAMSGVAARLEGQLGHSEEVAMAAITASELLHGVHRATEEHRGRREAFVEAVLTAIPVLAFDLLVARVHARLWSALAQGGVDVGAHDRIVAATAISAGWRVAAGDIRHFSRVTELDVVVVRLA